MSIYTFISSKSFVPNSLATFWFLKFMCYYVGKIWHMRKLIIYQRWCWKKSCESLLNVINFSLSPPTLQHKNIRDNRGHNFFRGIIGYVSITNFCKCCKEKTTVLTKFWYLKVYKPFVIWSSEKWRQFFRQSVFICWIVRTNCLWLTYSNKI